MTAETEARARQVADGIGRRRAPEPVREPGGGELRIGRHTVGAGHPALLIAEIGNNHNGSVALALSLIHI